MLRYDMTEVIRTPGMRQALEVNEPPYEDEDVEFVAPVTGRVVVTNTGTLLLVRGPIDTVIAAECSRCLADVRVPIHADVEEEFDLQEIDDPVHHDKQVQVVEEEVGQVFEGKTLCLDVLIRQAALLNAPLQPLCREECPGLPQKATHSEPAEGEYKNSPFGKLKQIFEDDTTPQGE